MSNFNWWTALFAVGIFLTISGATVVAPGAGIFVAGFWMVAVSQGRGW